MNWAGFVLTLLVLGVFMVSAFCFQEDFERRRRDEQETEKEPDRRRDRHRHMSRRGRELMLEKPRELFSSEGGSLRVWEKIPALEESEIDVQAARFILRQRGMILPKYDDSACMGYVEEGTLQPLKNSSYRTQLEFSNAFVPELRSRSRNGIACPWLYELFNVDQLQHLLSVLGCDVSPTGDCLQERGSWATSQATPWERGCGK